MSLKKPVFDVLEKSDSIDFTFSSTMENIDTVCDQTTAYLQSKVSGIEKQIFPINLVIREGLTNAVRHGNTRDPDKNVRFLVAIENNESIKIMIEDEGNGFDWRTLQNQELPEDETHGRGIIIMDTYFSRYSFNEKGNILYLEKDLFS
ncbi:MAG: ATP-binding protein [Desulfobacteraceae bacterium]|nr:ATP-binding protein [Desulfobacteraceae bacterium]